MSDDITLKVRSETIGYHKGALAMLAKERNELVKRLQMIEQMMEMHLEALRELGVKLVFEEEGPAEE